MSLTLREATDADLPAIARFVRALADYERLAHQAVAAEADFAAALFGTPRRAGCLIAERGGAAAGFALHHRTFSTFLGKPGRRLEDLWVEPACRRRGIARALFARLSADTIAEGGARLAWNVLDRNRPAIAAYDAMGADALADWTMRRPGGAALHTLAAEARRWPNPST
ncbi:MAG: GNAT family N-acetyltransferase [Acetobacteraceae bacterium]|nr:GNAT family N-acetyltransferase [Acetobacteraceae bacterium]